MNTISEENIMASIQNKRKLKLKRKFATRNRSDGERKVSKMISEAIPSPRNLHRISDDEEFKMFDSIWQSPSSKVMKLSDGTLSNLSTPNKEMANESKSTNRKYHRTRNLFQNENVENGNNDILKSIGISSAKKEYSKSDRKKSSSPDFPSFTKETQENLEKTPSKMDVFTKEAIEFYCKLDQQNYDLTLEYPSTRTTGRKQTEMEYTTKTLKARKRLQLS